MSAGARCPRPAVFLRIISRRLTHFLTPHNGCADEAAWTGVRMRALVVLVILAVAFDWIALKGQYSNAVWDNAKYDAQLLNIEVERMLQKLGR
jgi:hypothetical protein